MRRLLAAGCWLLTTACATATTGTTGTTAGAERRAPSAERAPRTILVRGDELLEARRLVRARDPDALARLARLLADADSALMTAPLAVTQKQVTPPSGDKHDFLSLAPYWWPDSTKAGGLPYVRRDGLMNPQSRLDHDGVRFQRMTAAVEALALAHFLTGDRRYAEQAGVMLRTWFLDPATRMNPHLRYAQAVLGVSEGRGIGIIDLRVAPQLLDAVRLLEGAPGWSAADEAGLQRWWRAYRDWLVESPNGKDERDEANNHGTWYDAQAGAVALYVGDSALARDILGRDARQRLAAQVAPDGRQPHEIARTRPLHYSLFNLDAFTQVAEMGRHVGADLWRHVEPNGSSLGAALRFVAPYTLPGARFEKADVTPIVAGVWRDAFWRAHAVLGEPIFATVAREIAPTRDRITLQYPRAVPAGRARTDSLADAALRHAMDRLEAAATTLDPARGFPRVTDSTGAWVQRPAREWTSGFFGGTLWYLYQATRDPAWRLLAREWTYGLESLKDTTSTHDLGFLLFDSFGNGHLLTGDTAYRRVVLEASRSLATRYDARVGAIRSWDTERVSDRRREWTYPVIVDNLMNLEMLFWAARNGGDTAWARLAERHALTSARAHLRPDGSTAHAALFDPATGALVRTATWQGHADSSTWARGQAWAIHGLAASYRFTRNDTLLRAAERAADWFVSHLPADGVPFWDFTHPDIPRTERDASAAAIAAAGLYDLARWTTPERAVVYRAAAERMVAALSSTYLTKGTPMASVLMHATGQRPQGVEIDVGITYADYYFVEALLRRKGMFLE